MGAGHLIPRLFVQAQGKPLAQPSVVDEDEHRPGAFHTFQYPLHQRPPYRLLVHGPHSLGRHGDRNSQPAFHGAFHNMDRPGSQTGRIGRVRILLPAAQVAGHPLHRLLGSGNPDALGIPAA
ncbi:hypothetical protein D3C75_563600 [compost metagenome]